MMTKPLRVILWGVALLALAFPLLSFVCISWFNFPYADDYDWSNQAREFGSVGVVWHSYFAWHGRYFSTLLLGFNPLVFGWMRGYAILPLLLMFTLVWLGTLRLRSWLNLKSFGAIVISIAVLLLWMLSIPNPTEAIYWMAGSLTYTVPVILVLLFWHIEEIMSSSLRITVALCSALSFCVVGSNETIMVCFSGYVFALFVFSIIEEDRRPRMDYLLYSIVCFIGAIIVIKAPGNAVRLAHFEHNNDFFHSISTSIRMSYDIVFAYFSSLPFWLLSILILLLKVEGSKTAVEKENNRPLYILALGFVLMLLSIFPAVWSTGAVPPRRTVNTTHVIFLLNWLYLLRILRIRMFLADFYASEGSLSSIRGLVMPFILLLSAISMGTNMVVLDIVSDFQSGRVWKYEQQVEERVLLVKNWKESQSDDILSLPLIYEPPQIVFSTDLKSDPEDWINEGFANFYGLTAVRSFRKEGLKLAIETDER